jgi:uncharacterized protein (DUF1330 family)
MPVTFVVIARIPRAGIERFQRYEAAVLPLIVEHGGRLERRLRSAEGDVEVHVLSFADPDGLAAYLDDPRRAEHRELLAASGAELELLEVDDIATA